MVLAKRGVYNFSEIRVNVRARKNLTNHVVEEMSQSKRR